MSSLEGRTSLEEHETKLLKCMTAIQPPPVNEQQLITEDRLILPGVTSVLMTALDGRTSLEVHEEELLTRMVKAKGSNAINPGLVLRDTNVIIEELTSVLLQAVRGRLSLKSHEQELLSTLVAIEPTIVKDFVLTEDNFITEVVTKVLVTGLKGRNSLRDNEQRILGMLATIAFWKADDATQMGFLQFPQCCKINLAVIPGMYKQSNMLEEASLSRAQLKIGMKWMNHLPQHFHQELIGKLFLELNQAHAIGMLQEHHNRYMRCNIKDSSALKSFVGLNDAQYVCLL